MKRKKRIEIIFGIIISIALILTACSKTGSFIQKETNNPIEIEFWYGLTGTQSDTMESFIDEYNQSQDKYFVKGVSFDSYDVTAKALESALAKGKGPAVVLLEDYQMYKFAKRGALMQIDELVEKKKNFNIDDINPKFLKQVKIEEKTYGMPIYGTTQILYYRKDIFEKANISENVLDTWEGLAEAAKKLKKQNQEEILVYGWEPMQGRENLIDASINRGGRILNEQGTEVLIDERPWVETWDSFRKWIHEDKTMKVHFGGEGWQYWYATIDDVMQGRAAGYTGSAGDVKELDMNIIGAHIQPAWKGYEQNPVGVSNAHTICIPIFTTQADAEAAFEWISFFTSREITSKWSMETGYLPVRISAMESEEYKKFVENNTFMRVALEQMLKTKEITYDPTGGEIYEALRVAAEKVQILNIPAEIALKEAKEAAQKALDETLKE